MILIYPYWNVDDDVKSVKEYEVNILIYPYWNVDYETTENSKPMLWDFNLSILECRSRKLFTADEIRRNFNLSILECRLKLVKYSF